MTDPAVEEEDPTDPAADAKQTDSVAGENELPEALDPIGKNIHVFA